MIKYRVVSYEVDCLLQTGRLRLQSCYEYLRFNRSDLQCTYKALGNSFLIMVEAPFNVAAIFPATSLLWPLQYAVELLVREDCSHQQITYL